MDKTVYVDFVTKITAAAMNTISDTVWDALGQAKTPQDARSFIGAIEEAPADGGMYLRSNTTWQSATTSLQHNALAGRTQSDAHPIAAITGLQNDLDLLSSTNASQDAAIALKANTSDVNAKNALQDAEIALKADKTYVDSENDAQDAIFAAADALNVKKTSNTGTALIPAGTEAQRDATPQMGAIRFSSTATGWEGWNGTAWVSIGGGQMLGLAAVKGIFYNAQVIAENVTVAAGTNGLSAGPVSVADGFTVTVSNGSTFTVV